MKYKLTKPSRKRHTAILQALKNNASLVSLLAVVPLAAGGGCSPSDAPPGDVIPGRMVAPQEMNRKNESAPPVPPGEPPAASKEFSSPALPGKVAVFTTAGIPVPPPPPPLKLPEKTTVYQVRKGDSMWSIARKHRISLEVLLALNRMSRKNADKIRIGDKITVPVLTEK